MTVTRTRLYFARYLSMISALAVAPFAHAESACHYVEVANLDISYPKLRLSPAVHGEINGSPVNMLFDTGAGMTYLLRSDVEKLGMTPARKRAQAFGVGGHVSIFQVRIKDFAIGAAHVRNVDFPVIEALDDTALSGIVGDDFLLQYDVELNLRAKQVKLFQPEYCGDKGLAYWNPAAQTVPMQFEPDSKRPMIQVQINGAPIWALVDTGAAHSALDLAAARRLGLNTDAPGVTAAGKASGVGNEKRKVWNMTFDSFAIGDEVIQHPRISVIEDGAYPGRKPHEMLLGHDFLSTHHVLLAASQMLMYFSYEGGQVFHGDDPQRAPAPPVPAAP
jgi:clan AA aspartic protease (TIGR02281 family)